MITEQYFKDSYDSLTRSLRPFLEIRGNFFVPVSGGDRIAAEVDLQKNVIVNAFRSGVRGFDTVISELEMSVGDDRDRKTIFILNAAKTFRCEWT
jgi:hypothetical protein